MLSLFADSGSSAAHLGICIVKGDPDKELSSMDSTQGTTITKSNKINLFFINEFQIRYA